MLKPIVVDMRTQHRLVTKTLPKCPTCGMVMDGSTGPLGRYPSPGDLSISFCCLEALVYEAAPGGLSVRKLSEEERAALPEETRVTIGLFIALYGKRKGGKTR